MPTSSGKWWRWLANGIDYGDEVRSVKGRKTRRGVESMSAVSLVKSERHYMPEAETTISTRRFF